MGLGRPHHGPTIPTTAIRRLHGVLQGISSDLIIREAEVVGLKNSVFLFYSKAHGDWVTNLKLQKLIYYAQAWHLALYKTPIFDDPIQAWIHGPVVYSVYNRFKHHRWDPITNTPPNPNLPTSLIKHLEEVYDVFGSYSAFDLEKMTHNETPWINARGGMSIDQPSHNPISQQDMAVFYSNLAEQDNG